MRHIAHIILDEKFIDMGLREFELAAPGIHLPILIGEPHELRYIKHKQPIFMSLQDTILFVQSDDCSCVIFHSLPDEFIPILTAIPEEKTITWIGWGFDYYHRLLSPAFQKGLLLDKTSHLMKTCPEVLNRRKLSSRIRRFARKIFCPNEYLTSAAISKVNYFCPVLDIEFDMAKNLNPWFTAKYICWNYGTVEDDLSPINQPTRHLGDNILVGNSATPENNHLEIFETLARQYDTNGRQIITPLSYGNPWYREKVIAVGKELFGHRFVPLVEYMPQDRYVNFLDSCGFVFMNHVRQQALGNICIMLLKGAKIHLNDANPLYKWLIGRGMMVESIYCHNIECPKEIELQPLTEVEKDINATSVRNFWGRGAQRAKTRHLVEIALNQIRT